MTLQILRKGSKGKEVKRWQNFLIGQGHLRARADGDFGPLTEKATKAFQRSQGQSSDGIVGPQTLGRALLLGFDAGFEDRVEPDTNPVLVSTPSLRPATARTRERLFGTFEYEPAPTSRNPERIRILGDWESANIQMVTLPQLRGVPVYGTPSSGRLRFHKKAVEQLKALWAAWEEAGVLHHVLTYEGSYNPRFIRGSRETLSNHAYGSAFDINYQWNRLGAVPALEGQEGSVRELVDIANEHGFYWGGHFQGRPDGMHFEVAKLL
jgi:peptidoglycan hydrolase-like protein with peptidoglycan-binding domain